MPTQPKVVGLLSSSSLSFKRYMSKVSVPKIVSLNGFSRTSVTQANEGTLLSPDAYISAGEA